MLRYFTPPGTRCSAARSAPCSSPGASLLCLRVAASRWRWLHASAARGWQACPGGVRAAGGRRCSQVRPRHPSQALPAGQRGGPPTRTAPPARRPEQRYRRRRRAPSPSTARAAESGVLRAAQRGASPRGARVLRAPPRPLEQRQRPRAGRREWGGSGRRAAAGQPVAREAGGLEAGRRGIPGRRHGVFLTPSPARARRATAGVLGAELRDHRQPRHEPRAGGRALAYARWATSCAATTTRRGGSSCTAPRASTRAGTGTKWYPGRQRVA